MLLVAALLTIHGNPSVLVGSYEDAVIAEINRVRAERGLDALDAHSLLMDRSKEHAEWMNEHDKLIHAPYRRDIAYFHPEIIAWGYKTPEAVVQGWLNSRGHRRIMLSDSKYIGAGKSGTYWCVQIEREDFDYTGSGTMPLRDHYLPPGIRAR